MKYKSIRPKTKCLYCGKKHNRDKFVGLRYIRLGHCSDECREEHKKEFIEGYNVSNHGII
jgi:hypothetical protein